MGDFSIYALHKILPTPSGGMLKVNNLKFEAVTKNIEQDNNLAALKSYVLADLSVVENIRRSNYLLLADKICKLEGISLLYPTLPGSVVPHNLPFLVEDGLREKLYFRLIERGIPVVSLYYRLIPSLGKTSYPDAHYLSDNMLNLPVHQEITNDDVFTIAKELEGALLDVRS